MEEKNRTNHAKLKSPEAYILEVLYRRNHYIIKVVSQIMERVKQDTECKKIQNKTSYYMNLWIKFQKDLRVKRNKPEKI